MTLTRERPELDQPIESVGQLLDYFAAGEKPRERWRVGTEHEKLGLYQDTHAPIPYAGPRGIGALLARLVERHGFTKLMQGDLIVGLEKNDGTVTLEPGGALELGGAPLRSVHETCAELAEHLAVLKEASREFGIVWLGLGMHPFASLDEMPRMPHDRYQLMRSFLGKRGELSLYMMHATCGVQANYDYLDEADMARKLRVAQAASPIVSALYANSPLAEGKPSGFESRRMWVWRNTDPDRSGFLPFVFEDAWRDHAYRLYAEWALDRPMLFIRRDGRHLAMQGRSFRDYLAKGYGEISPTLADWSLHLTTLFPEVRLKQVIEVRGADAVSAPLACALPALWKGIFYDEEALRAVEQRLGHWGFEDVDGLHAGVARRGLDARTVDGPLLEVAREIVELSALGLRRIGDTNARGEDESVLLAPLREILARGTSPGRELLELWEGAWGRRADRLFEYARY
jgi:glutamate--cysteine ligase